ncbi:HEAT repeat domain-containing protein [Xanthomonas sp. D-109]|uniref:HEAT repeat domain-containing protein n=1 Tax=Xanthomonas sp. D-109 TaxID=2821274 RepID=UPI001ADB7989|nr:HEAT repeat domain-containing protein [Xanthomonas sp. D-109]MBO9880512.1 HEAT repeat domain-containing protein [Xanthomonas sp. D-109]
MAITPKISAQPNPISLDDFLEKARRTINVREPESALALSDDLASLAMNETLVPDAIEAQVNGFLNGIRHVSYTPQSIILGGGDGFYVRANIWTPPRLCSAIREQEERIFSYNLAHDHNFAFLTAGYFGAGYRTEIFDYDPKQVVGYIGEKVDITPLEQTSLPKGKVMFYRMRRDIHIQHPPEELSISLNLMMISPESEHTEQYFFDTEAGIISGIPEAAYVYRRASLATLLGEVGDEASLPLLHSLLEEQPNRRIRISALQSIYRLHERLNQSTTVASGFIDDQDPLVAEAARRLRDGQRLGADLDLASAADLYKRD